MEPEYPTEDNGFTLYCDTCQGQVRTNEMHCCPGEPVPLVDNPGDVIRYALTELMDCFSEMTDFNDIPQTLTVDALRDAQKALEQIDNERACLKEIVTVLVDDHPWTDATWDGVSDALLKRGLVYAEDGNIKDTMSTVTPVKLPEALLDLVEKVKIFLQQMGPQKMDAPTKHRLAQTGHFQELNRCFTVWEREAKPDTSETG